MQHGELEAGQKLNEVKLAESLGVSRGTVREAIRSLAESGLIELVSNRGAFVRRPTVSEVRDLYELRGAIFGMSCAAVARRIADSRDDALVAALQENLESMQVAFDEEDAPAYYDLNIAFHDMLLTAGGNARAKRIYDRAVNELHLIRRRGLSALPSIETSIAEHRAILKAITDANTAEARMAAITHVESGLARFMRFTTHDTNQPL